MSLAEESQAISEILESGGPWQFEGERARLEYSHHVILRWALDTKALHEVFLLSSIDPCRKVRLRGGTCHRHRQQKLLVGLYL
jgi:hypothetical protein